MKRALLLLGIALLATPLRAEVSKIGIAATVNGHVITTAEVDRQMESWLAWHGGYLQGEVLEQAKREHRKEVVNALIERDLIFQAFYNEGDVVSESQIDQCLVQIINQQYGGDHAAFLNTLEERGITLQKYRQEIANNYIIGFMRSKHTALDWQKSLRANAQIEIF